MMIIIIIIVIVMSISKLSEEVRGERLFFYFFWVEGCSSSRAGQVQACYVLFYNGA